MCQESTSTSWGLNDVVQVDGRTGTVSVDLRPGHNYVKVIWSDTQTESEVVCADEVKSMVSRYLAFTHSFALLYPGSTGTVQLSNYQQRQYWYSTAEKQAGPAVVV